MEEEEEKKEEEGVFMFSFPSIVKCLYR